MNKLRHFILLLAAPLFAVALLSSCDDNESGTMKIYNKADLIYFQERVNDNYEGDLNAVLMGNINLEGEEWIPIGDDYYSPFYATFNGNGFTISNLTISTSLSHQGLFGYVYEGTITNVILENPQIEGDRNVGALCGRVFEDSSISSCKVVGGSIKGSENVGGLIGNIYYADIKDCYSTASVEGSSKCVGGLIGLASMCEIENCYNTGSVTSEGGYSGGVVGYPADSQLAGCYNTGDVTSTGDFVGGVGGYSSGYISASYNTGRVKGVNFVGGVAGSSFSSYTTYIPSSYITSCFNTGVVSGVECVAGVAGRTYSSTVIDGCYYLNNSNLEGVILDDGEGVYTSNSDGAESLNSYSELNANVDTMNEAIEDFIRSDDDGVDIAYRFKEGSPADSTIPEIYKY
ncbi:MAG: GLUG motif-containing protein [Rikenellaceae bacterium]